MKIVSSLELAEKRNDIQIILIKSLNFIQNKIKSFYSLKTLKQLEKF